MPEGEIPRMSLNQMPFGLLNYNICLFAKGITQMLGIEEYHVSWLATMFYSLGISGYVSTEDQHGNMKLNQRC